MIPLDATESADHILFSTSESGRSRLVVDGVRCGAVRWLSGSGLSGRATEVMSIGAIVDVGLRRIWMRSCVSSSWPLFPSMSEGEWERISKLVFPPMFSKAD